MEDIWLFILIGLAAQLVDGALGMAYGITCTSLLLSMGAPPALASASVHTAEVGTSAVSGASHWALGNVDRRLFWRLVLPGVAGAALGALLIGWVDGSKIKPLVAGYLLIVGLLVLWRTFRPRPPRVVAPGDLAPPPQGLLAGFLDAIGGGGWGSINVTTLIARGVPPRTVVGTVNAAEFFVSVTVAALLWQVVGPQALPVVGGLLIGGLIAAPIAALAARRVPPRLASGLTGGVVLLLSVSTLAHALI
ncbi:sulfite exporter TauE/SafE family protein [Pseudomarimonas salicorniae]|uniref:Probable membrane transporter protein n=1 Tax=Pseudomarimonas salicorniae TaxID=2933270 RepID=A0ABT0GEM8_9GAMM|nr:sulfite exporter TauE/SafE family protein [Lysobacter sp. CAU 1642]MCK7592470.1 sulfite exporter TauE/SafE family protein [Lysobacter sp. CAU 1642]